MKTPTHLFRRATAGAALVEYGLLVGLVAVVAIGSVASMGSEVRATFAGVSAALSGAIGAEAADEVEEVSVAPVPAVGEYAVTVGYAGNYRGYMSPQFSTSAGSIERTTGPYELLSLLTYTVDNTFWFTVADDVRDEMAGMHALDCGDFGEFLFADVKSISFTDGGGIPRTWTRWDDAQIPADGSTLECRLIAQ